MTSNNTFVVNQKSNNQLLIDGQFVVDLELNTIKNSQFNTVLSQNCWQVLSTGELSKHATVVINPELSIEFMLNKQDDGLLCSYRAYVKLPLS